MFTQQEILTFHKLQTAHKLYEAMVQTFKERWANKEEQESGPVVLTVSVAHPNNVSYKEVVETIKKNHPELKGAITRCVDENTTVGDRYTWAVKPVVVQV